MRLLNQVLELLSARYLGGIPVDRVATVVAVLFSYLLAHAFQRIPARLAPVRHLFSVLSTVVLFGFVQEQYLGLLHMAVGATVVYVLMRCVQGARMPQAVFLATMLHMSYSHIRRQMGEARSGRMALDYTGAQMVFVVKATSLAFCIDDGRKLDSGTLSSYQRRNAIVGVPGLLEYLGYVFFFPGFSVGPAFEMATYRRMVALDDSRAKSQLSGRAYRKLLEGIFWMVVYIVYGTEYTFAAMAQRQFYTHRSFVSAAMSLCVAGVMARAPYYTAWKMSEGACILAGLGYDGYGKDGKVRWMDIANVHVRGMELGTSLRELIDSWNIGTNTWLRHHVYLRINGSRTRATVLTFLVSAWWHGFYAGYYLTFVLAALAASAARILRRNLNPIVRVAAGGPVTFRRRATKAVYDGAGWALSKYTLDFVAAPFMLLSLHASLRIWYYNLFAVPLGVACIFLAFNVLGVGRFLPVVGPVDG
ncbi:Lysophospholipid acyltransferase [Coemansia sp. RSA 552]|nr:Lysophospholipid acyltransferase [Coemansia sp. RSA 552]